jgi:hypothetical protein
MRRPPSLSEGCINVGNYESIYEKMEPLSLTIRNSIQGDLTPVAVLPVKEAGPEIHTWEETVADYTLRFLLHISLISFFETIFFFKFVSVDEDKGITDISNFYTHKILNSCANLSGGEVAFINSILSRFVNISNIDSDGVSSATNRYINNQVLYKTSWSYFAGISGCFVLLSLISVLRKYNIRWGYIIIENVIFVSMLGLYEFAFFLNIIKNYGTITPQEITMGFANGLQTTCGLLK